MLPQKSCFRFSSQQPHKRKPHYHLALQDLSYESILPFARNCTFRCKTVAPPDELTFDAPSAGYHATRAEGTMDKVKQAVGQGIESVKLAVQDPDVHEAASRPATSLGTKMEKGLEKGAELAQTTAKKINPDTMTTLDGRPLGDNYNSISAGKQGPLLITEDINLYEKNVSLQLQRSLEVNVCGSEVGRVWLILSEELCVASSSIFFKTLRKAEVG